MEHSMKGNSNRYQQLTFLWQFHYQTLSRIHYEMDMQMIA